MSYCRWSSDNFKSDLYVYANVSGAWTIHVAGRRYVGPVPDVPDIRGLADGSVSVDDYTQACRLRSAWMEEHGTEPIDLPYAGETFDTVGPAECADKCEELAALGYHVPAWVVPDLRQEAAALSPETDQ